MLEFRSQVIDKTVMVQFVVPGLSDGTELEQNAGKLCALIDPTCNTMVIDLSRVRFISSSALSMFIAVRQRIDYFKGRIAITGLSEQLKLVFRITGLDRSVPLYKTTTEAIEALNAQQTAP